MGRWGLTLATGAIRYSLIPGHGGHIPQLNAPLGLLQALRGETGLSSRGRCWSRRHFVPRVRVMSGRYGSSIRHRLVEGRGFIQRKGMGFGAEEGESGRQAAFPEPQLPSGPGVEPPPPAPPARGRLSPATVTVKPA